MPVEISNKTRSIINLKRAENVLESLLKHYKLSDRVVSLVFIGDQRMQNLNKQWRHKDRPTDILSFDGGEDYLGELIVDWQQIKRQAPKWSRNASEEMVFIVVHGFLHLLGFDDKSLVGAKRMEVIGENLIKKLKL